MKLLADENIPSSVVRALADGGYDIIWIRTEAPGISDAEVM
jgi:predicted nuclease of predicted toxin-antitoxin system